MPAQATLLDDRPWLRTYMAAPVAVPARVGLPGRPDAPVLRAQAPSARVALVGLLREIVGGTVEEDDDGGEE